MAYGMIGRLASLLAVASLASAQFPLKPEGITVLQSKFGDGISISYKETKICETTPGVKSYAGYVHLPPGTLNDVGEAQDYPINTFFWFHSARKYPETAPLSIWMNGGPGSSSLAGALVENGPCYVHHDSNSTYLNPFSWNNEVNMLYFDQPVQAGLSYDALQNITYNAATGEIDLLNPGDKIPVQNTTFLVGTYPSQNSSQTAVGTKNAAKAAWHFVQAFTEVFPQYRAKDDRISIATESYGGRYGPAFAAYFEEQNEAIQKGSYKAAHGKAALIHLDSLLIVNGCIDRLVQYPTYAIMAYNNTYDLPTVNETIYQEMNHAWSDPGACRDQILSCRAAAAIYDPQNLGINTTVNTLCRTAQQYCENNIIGPGIIYTPQDYYDIGAWDPDPVPEPFFFGYMNQPHVQKDLGARLNWTINAKQVNKAFVGIGDYVRDGGLQDLAYLLEKGVKVALVYGDRDYACNWFGGEAVSLAVNYTDTKAFHAAGYASIQTNASYVGGKVRQHGNLSFSRVFESGHQVPTYQPQTAYEIFNRVLSNRDVATGKINTAKNGKYSTAGPSDSLAFRNKAPERPVQYCYTAWLGDTCDEEHVGALLNGTATVCDYLVKDANTTMLFPDIVGKLGEPGCAKGVGGGHER
ncbi:hypothetical protein B0A48_07250 [Cryoendolithus antarcticus]|uniref:Carboxypeptidase n=1 Tax=Cryoendolithus antarcticus TaxID=1507870 RepID=A0A1V8T817_9PEZI|nr:hypothetical protein B0A48_07250 [Cryoendolithus antarcticus]